MKTSRQLIALAAALLGVAAAASAQSTSGSSGKGTTEPGASSAEASSFGNTGRSPSVTGSNDPAPKVPGTGATATDPANRAESATAFHGGGANAEILFRKLDANGDGQLSREEFAKLASVMGTAGAAKPSGTSPAR